MNQFQQLIDMALQEDLGSGDITTDNIVDPKMAGIGSFKAKEPLVIAGMDIARQVFSSLDPDLEWQPNFADGDDIQKGDRILEIKGKLRALLHGERTALNFLQRLSGIATMSRAYARALENNGIKLVDTRKTTPGWRVLEKYAVRAGGAHNHRMGLFDGALIKDNHIAVAGSLEKAVAMVRRAVSHFVKIEVEVTDMNEVRQALKAGAEIIMLDNMTMPQIREAVSIIKGRAMVEISGNVTIEKLPELADTGVDLISSGALTHSARSVDISMMIEPILNR